MLDLVYFDFFSYSLRKKHTYHALKKPSLPKPFGVKPTKEGTFFPALYLNSHQSTHGHHTKQYSRDSASLPQKAQYSSHNTLKVQRICISSPTIRYHSEKRLRAELSLTHARHVMHRGRWRTSSTSIGTQLLVSWYN